AFGKLFSESRPLIGSPILASKTDFAVVQSVRRTVRKNNTPGSLRMQRELFSLSVNPTTQLIRLTDGIRAAPACVKVHGWGFHTSFRLAWRSPQMTIHKLLSVALIAGAAGLLHSGGPVFAQGEAAVKKIRPRVEVVFCLDTTGSMGGLIDGAKQKIWS